MTDPEPVPGLTINALSLELGIDRRTLTRRLRDVQPTETRGRNRLYALRDVLDAIIGGTSTDGLNRARTRLAEAQADKAELEMLETRGKLCRVEAVAKTWEGMILNCRQRLLGIPSKISPRLEGRTAREIHGELEKEIHQALTELSRGRAKKKGSRHATN